MGIELSNQMLTRGIAPEALQHDLSKLTLGSFRDPRNGLKRILLGDEKFSVAVELNPRGDPRSIYVHRSDGTQIYGVSLNGRHSWQTLCDVVLRCCDKHSTDELQTYLKRREPAESLRRLENFPSPAELKKQNQQMMDCHQFAGINLPPVGEFNARLKTVPFMSFHDFMGFADPTQLKKESQLIRSESILGTSSDRNWHIVERGDDYIYRIASSLTSNAAPWHSDAQPIQIAVFDGVAFVWNGRHRSAAVKGIDNPELSIRAERIELGHPVKVVAWSEADRAAIIERMASGLFSARPDTPASAVTGLPNSLYASWIVESYAAPWVFSRDLPAAENMYNQMAARKT